MTEEIYNKMCAELDAFIIVHFGDEGKYDPSDEEYEKYFKTLLKKYNITMKEFEDAEIDGF